MMVSLLKQMWVMMSNMKFTKTSSGLIACYSATTSLELLALLYPCMCSSYMEASAVICKAIYVTRGPYLWQTWVQGTNSERTIDGITHIVLTMSYNCVMISYIARAARLATYIASKSLSHIFLFTL